MVFIFFLPNPDPPEVDHKMSSIRSGGQRNNN